MSTKINTQATRSWSFFPTFALIVAFALSAQAMFTIPTEKQTAKAGEITTAVTEVTTKAVETKAEGVSVPQGIIEAKTVASEVKLDDKTELEPVAEPVRRVMTFLATKKHAYTQEYVQILYTACDSNAHSLYSLIAVSGHETVYGTLGSPIQGYVNNFWGWGYNSKTKSYMSGNYEFMARNVCIGFGNGGMYSNLISSKGVVNSYLAKLYSGNDRANIWAENVSQNYLQIINTKL